MGLNQLNKKIFFFIQPKICGVKNELSALTEYMRVVRRSPGLGGMGCSQRCSQDWCLHRLAGGWWAPHPRQDSNPVGTTGEWRQVRLKHGALSLRLTSLATSFALCPPDSPILIRLFFFLFFYNPVYGFHK